MTRKRGNGDGSFRQRPDGRWEARLSLTGGNKSYYGRTRAEVKAKIEAARRDAEAGLDLLTPDQTVAQFLARWLEDVARPAIRPTTYESHESNVRCRVLPALGAIKLRQLTPQHLQALYGQLLARGLSPASVVRTHALLHGAFKQALLWNLIPRNPADAVRPPRTHRTEMHVLDRDQVLQLLEAAEDPALRALYAVAATAGLRRGELLALRWSDLDFERAVLTVRRTAQRIRGEGWVFGEPKTHAGRRAVRLGELALRHLRAQRTAQLEQRLRAGSAWNDLDLVFASGLGTPIEEARISRLYRRDLQRAGLPTIRLHDLRHTAATLLIEQGVNFKAVQAALGHSTIAVTLDIYAHVTPAMQDSVADAMDRIFAVE
jgi:integrase